MTGRKPWIPVRVVWRSRIRHGNGGEDRIDGQGAGRLRIWGQTTVLRYDESAVMGMQVETALRWRGCGQVSRCRLIRRGDVRMYCDLAVGTKTAGWYETPFGRWMFDAVARTIEVQELPRGWKIRLAYELGWGDDAVSDARVEVTVLRPATSTTVDRPTGGGKESVEDVHSP
ncbi:MAG: DUF1934 domain-containing protein [Alicyclobacillaceae bacterium]|nr:DUF1934 domain-containing protein [Alicyclobacillaceae bacterium]